MAEITFNVSQDAAQYIKTAPDGSLDLRERAMLLYPAIADLTISHGRAAELLGIHKWDLIELYADMGIPYIKQTWEEVEQDIKNIDIAIQRSAQKKAVRA
ncbi:MAG: UPF0175 family protein [Spirochaetaceae bacterium]|nr:UPF0175 family protein [Spirochaetaceae bacterium]